METKKIPLSKLHLNTGQIKDVPKNPRFIKDERFAALKKSIEDDPEMLSLRELVAYDNNGEFVVILGNMRYRAMKELGYKDAPVKVLPAETDAKKLRAYIQKDNIAFGQNDWDLLGNEWDIDEGDFYSMCEHHMMPFFGRYWFAYIPNPNGRILGISKIGRVVDYCAARLQIQERLVHDVVTMLAESLGTENPPLGIALIMEGEHLCKSMRGAKKKGKMKSSYLTGIFKTDAQLRSEFLNLIHK